MKISPEQARANIIAAYTKEHNEAVAGLTAAIDRVKSTKEVKKNTNADSDKPETPKSLADLLRQSAQERE